MVSLANGFVGKWFCWQMLVQTMNRCQMALFANEFVGKRFGWQMALLAMALLAMALLANGS
jgi:hypothetical protein